jgi:superfamily I DNA/RNA helicase|tara:strand:- start:2294 stop:3727 length:1434 start_codon:yes stop_codon:yes gene_type:complete
MIKGTEEQEEIWNEIVNTNNDVIVNAGAGTGKTFTIVEGANRVNASRMGFLAFNKSIATELAERLPEHVEAKTFHALGMKAVRDAVGRTKVNNWKVKNIIDGILGRDYFAQPLVKLISLVKGSMIDCTDNKEIYKLIDEYNIEFKTPREEVMGVDLVCQILDECKKQTNEIDFDDMIWLPLVNDYPLPQFDILFVDEAQDFNEMQRQLVLACTQLGRCIIVGDKNQAIYGFRGADSGSMSIFENQLKARGSTVNSFGLTLTWRCPKSVVAEANRYVKEFNCLETAEDGQVHVNAYLNPQKGDMVLCRYNAPLVSAFYDLITQGKSAYILGRDMHKGLVNYVKKITKHNNMSSEEFMNLLTVDFKVNHAKLIDADKQNQANTLSDKFECVKIFASKADTVGGIIAEIERLFNSKTKGDIQLSTVHKAKGLEADNVFILATERMPHPKATNMQEERNICYVAITRAKKNLYYCGPRPKN